MRRLALTAALALTACGPSPRPGPSFVNAAYAYVADGHAWIANVDGTHEQIGDTAPAAVLDWSRDGRLAWLETENDGCRCKVAAWVADDQGIAIEAMFGTLNTGPDHLWSLRWSPSGGALAGVFGGNSRLSHDADVNEHFFVDLDTGEGREIGNPGGDAFPPVWSPDGGALIGRAWVFDSDPSDDRLGLFVHDFATRELGVPAIGEVRDTHPPVWSPDGMRIAFATPRAGTLDIHVADSPDGESRPLLEGACDDFAPRWIADGETLLVRRQCADAEPVDVVVDAESGAIAATVTGLAAWAELSPDGSLASWTEAVSGEVDREIVVYEIATARVVERVRGSGPRWRPALGDE